jgi:hypothetical protein
MSDDELLAEVDRQAEVLDPGHIRRITDERGVLSPVDVRPYITRAAHDDIPSGTPCLVSRPGDRSMLRLDFHDGRVVWTRGYAAGIEWRIEHGTAEYAERIAAEQAPDG